MKSILAFSSLAIALVLLPLFAFGRGTDLPAPQSLPDHVLRVSDHKILTLDGILEDLKSVRLVFVGELHDEPRHHQAQLAVISALHEAGITVAVGLEMFQKDSQEILHQWVAGTLDEKAFQKTYDNNWGYPWPLYSDIFWHARQNRIPMIGLNVSPDITRQVARKGFASLSEEQIGQMPEVTCRVDAAYMAFIRRSFGMHGHQGKRFVFFCEAQMVWDTAMAANLLAFLNSHSNHTVVVLAGNGHAWRHGIPEQITRQSNVSHRIILPAIPGRLDPETVSIDDGDYLWLGH